jgi:ABC-type lipoprotein release transport system permease subunit
MLILIKIALRNVLKNKRRTLLIGLSIFISSLIFLAGNAMTNGAEKQIMKGYVNYQTGHVVVFWENVKEISPDRPERLFGSRYDVKKDAENRRALANFNALVEKYGDRIEASYTSLFRVAYAHGKSTFSLVYSLTPKNRDFLLSTGTTTLLAGTLDFNDGYGVCISEKMAADLNLRLHDPITLEVTTPHGAKNSMDYQVTGICKNTAPWETSFVFMEQTDADALFDVDAGYFDIGRILLKNPDEAGAFAKMLDDELLKASPVLRAESYREASLLYVTLGSYQRTLATFFSFFLLFIIGMGIRSTVRMNLFERMQEFGTLRAIGYERFRIFLIVFFEILFLSFLALLAAVAVSGVFVFAFGTYGLYIGSGPMSYNYGGEYIYPFLVASDIITCVLAITILSLLSILKPALTICAQKISDILARRKKRVLVLLAMLRKVLARKPERI